MDEVSTCSDRFDDQRIIGGHRVTLRFLNQSIYQTYERVKEETDISISETTFRKVLTLPQNRHIKSGSRERKTAVCRKGKTYYLCIENVELESINQLYPL